MADELVILYHIKLVRYHKNGIYYCRRVFFLQGKGGYQRDNAVQRMSAQKAYQIGGERGQDCNEL